MERGNKESRAYTARIRDALRDLPAAIKAGDEDEVREILMEISGAAYGVAEALEIEGF